MTSSILTGQYVRIDLTPAGIGRRFLALLIDNFCMLGLVVTAVYLSKYIPWHLTGTHFIVLLLALYLYPLLFEVFNNGQTPGKRLLGLRVVKVNGNPPTVGDYLLRWLLFPIDLALSGGIGILCMIITKNHQRLGDLAGGTMVIKEKDYRHIHVSLDEYDYLTPDYKPTYPQAADLSLEQVDILTRTLNAHTKDQQQRIALLSRKVIQTLQLPPQTIPGPDLLQTLLHDYQFYALNLI